MNGLHIGIAGPIMLAPLKPYLEPLRDSPAPLPQGLGGSPVVNLVLELLKRNRRVTVFSLDSSVDSEVVLQGERLRICLGPYRARHRARDFFAVERAYLLQAMRREKPDIVHAHWTYEFALAALDSKILNLVTAHDAPLTILCYQPTAYRFLRMVMARQAARRAPFMTSVSEHVARQFTRRLGFRGDMRVIPNPLPEEVFASTPLNGRAPSDGSAIFATVLTGWSGYKNGAVVLRAFRELRRQLPGARLVMFGSQYGRGEFAQRWAFSRRLDEGVDFIGSVSYAEMIRRLGEVDFLLHPAREESFGMPMAEAMALGIPVIASAACRGACAILEGGRLGILVKSYRSGDWAEAMFRVQTQREPIRFMVEEAKNSAATRFRSSVVAEAYESSYRHVMGENCKHNASASHPERA